MEDEYGNMGDLRHYLGSRPLFPAPPDFNPYDMLIFGSDSTTNGGPSSSAGTGRWPRQETLTLLEIRSRLDPKFKEANHKGPLWDEVSRIMCEEHGYQRSGKKCREKFENLYKYYKKTKEGKAGRQDGKHYRFFRQLEALYGENNNNNNNPPLENQASLYPSLKTQETSVSLSNYSEDTSSSENSEKMWKLKIRELIDAQMKKLMDKQEAWMEEMMKAIEQKERDRIAREVEWRKQDAARVDREHKFWANQRAWIEARDAALLEALTNDLVWPDSEINRLLQLRAGMEDRLGAGLMSEQGELWEEVSSKMACFGHHRTALSCKHKWDTLNNYLLKKTLKTCYYQGHDPIADRNPNGNGKDESTNAAIGMSDGCFRYFMGDELSTECIMGRLGE